MKSTLDPVMYVIAALLMLLTVVAAISDWADPDLVFALGFSSVAAAVLARS